MPKFSGYPVRGKWVLMTLLFLFGFFAGGSQAANNSKLITLENDIMRVVINEQGAELWSIYDKANEVEYLWQADPKYWDWHAPIMFPAAVRLKDGRYTYKGDRYLMHQLGFIREVEFDAVRTKRNLSVMEYTLDRKKARLYYPFPFCFRVTRMLEKNVLNIEFTIENTGKETMYFGVGAHAAFMLPLYDRLDRSDYHLVFPEPVTVPRMDLEDGQVQNKYIDFLQNEKTFGLADERIPRNGILLIDSPIREIGLGFAEQEPFVVINLGDFPNFNGFIPDKPYVCLEPMDSHQDLAESPQAIDEKSHLVSLAPRKSKTYRYSITIHPENYLPPEK